MTAPTPPTVDTLAAELNTLKDHAYTLAGTHPDAVTEWWLRECWERLDAALWCLRQIVPTLDNPQPDMRAALQIPHSGNPITANERSV